MKRCILLLIKGAGIILLSALAGFLLLLAVFLIPTEPIESHIAESVPIFEEGRHPQLFIWCNSWLDNFTDALILMSSGYRADSSLAERALLVYRPVGTSTETGASLDPAQTLTAYCTDDPSAQFSVTSYGRYWHGYLLYTKPLLYFFSFQTIRLLNLLLETALLLATVYLLRKNNLKSAVLPYVLTWGMLVPWIMGLSLQFSDMYYIFSVGNLILLAHWRNWSKPEHFYLFFLLLGIATGYFDLLTYPLVSFGIPLILLFLLREPSSVRQGLREILLFGCVWAFGYLGMWSCKWFLATLFTGHNFIKEALSQVSFRLSRTGKEQEPISLFMVYARNIGGILYNPVSVPAVWFFSRELLRAHREGHLRSCRTLMMGSVSLLPLVWYFALANHSYIHPYYTCKNLAVTVLGCLCMCGTPTGEGRLPEAKAPQEPPSSQ